jgi:hypothetical protein
MAARIRKRPRAVATGGWSGSGPSRSEDEIVNVRANNPYDWPHELSCGLICSAGGWSRFYYAVAFRDVRRPTPEIVAFDLVLVPSQPRLSTLLEAHVAATISEVSHSIFHPRDGVKRRLLLA